MEMGAAGSVISVVKINKLNMKTTRIRIIASCLFLTAGILPAQEYKINVQNPKDVRVILKDFSGQLPIEAYSGNDIVFTSSEGKFEPPAKAKGLKPIFPGGTDNTGIGLDVEKAGNVITITCLIPFTQRSDYKIKMPESLAIELSSSCERSNDVIIHGMKGELDIQTCHNIELKDVTGPLVLSTISGDITVVYSNVISEKSSSVHSIGGDIDITLPVKTNVSLELNTISGGIYSDFDFPESKKDLKKIGGNDSNFDLNGGGFKYSIGSISGNVYLRKGN